MLTVLNSFVGTLLALWFVGAIAPTALAVLAVACAWVVAYTLLSVIRQKTRTLIAKQIGEVLDAEAAKRNDKDSTFFHIMGLITALYVRS